MRRFTFTPEVLATIRHERYHHPHRFYRNWDFIPVKLRVSRACVYVS
jgi:hypothetical protein